jgi:ectoine hydroxylase-related dioxygenase (phytanoyl-CoA dioxygenase family)
MSNPAVARVASDERLLGIARRFVGETAVPFRATLFEKTGQANWLIAWHQDLALPLVEKFDAPGWTSWSTKGGFTYVQAPAWALERVIALRLHLDDSTAMNGPLRVIPDSHHDGVLSDPDVWARAARGPEIECVVAKGGVIAMRPLLIHASSKCEKDLPRRVLHIEYADSLELAPGIKLALA